MPPGSFGFLVPVSRNAIREAKALRGLWSDCLGVWVCVAVCRLSLVAMSGGYSLVAGSGFLTVATSLVKHRL